MFTRMIRFIVLIATLAVAASMGASPIFCDRFDGELCLDLPRILLTVPDLEIFESGELLIELEHPAPAGGLQVFLSSSDATILELPGSVTVSEFQSDLSVPISTDAAYGAVRITATGQHYRAAIVEVSVTPPSLAFEMGPLVEVGQSRDGDIELSQAATEGGATITLSSSDPSLITISPAQVTIQEGAQSTPISITGVGSGLVELSASAPGYADDSITVRSTHNIVTVGAIPELVPGERRSLAISLLEPAPAGGLTIVLESADPAIATVEASVEIPEGRHFPYANAQVDGIALGSTEITARTEGFAPISRSVTVGKFQMSFSPDPVPIHVGWTVPMTVSLSKPAPEGGLEISLSNQDDTILTSPPSIFIPAGQTSANLEITALDTGLSSLLAQADGSEDASIDIIVDPTPGIALEDFFVGKDLQGEHQVSLSQRPTAPTNLNLTVADSDIAVISSAWHTLGTGSISFSNVFITTDRHFYIQGLSQGVTTITASATGFADAEATLTVTDSGFYITSPDSISKTTNSNMTTIVMRSAGIYPDGSWMHDQKVRAGLSIEAPIISADPDIGHITTSPVVFDAGPIIFEPEVDYRTITHFVPNAVGTTIVDLVQPVGFTAPSDRTQSIDVEVRSPDIALANFKVGKDLQDLHGVRLNAPASQPTELVLTVADPAIALISTAPTTVGSSLITFNNVSNTTERLFYVQGLSLGTTTITATASGFDEVEATLTVTESGFYISSPAGISTTPYSSPTNIEISAARLHSDGSFSENQQVRAGLSVEVPVTSVAPLVGQIVTSPVVFTAGSGFRITKFDPHAVGTTTVDLSQPTGFTPPNDRNSSIEAEVRPPGIGFRNFVVGENLQSPGTVRLIEPPPQPVDLVLTVADPSIAVISSDRTAVGSGSITFSNVINTGNQAIYVQGLSQGATTITASATGYNDRQVTVHIIASGFYISSPSGISKTPVSSPTNITIKTAYRMAGDWWFSGQEARAGLSVEVPVTNSNPLIGEITTSPVVFEAGQGTSVATQFVPNSIGTTTISLTQPDGHLTPILGQSIQATVRAPSIILNRFTVGKDLQGQHWVRLMQSPPEPVDLVLTIADPGIALISTERTAVGSGSVTFSKVNNTNQSFFIQGLSQGTTTITASAAGHDDREVTLTVTASGFTISWPWWISTTTNSNPTEITIATARIHTDGWWNAYQEIRPGLSIEVPVTSADPLVGQITTSPVVFEAGLGSNITTEFDPNAVGTTAVNLTQPPGFGASAFGRLSIDAEVRKPGLRFIFQDIGFNSFSIGKNLQRRYRVHLRVPPPEPMDLVLTVADPAIALISTEQTIVGSGTITFDNVSDTGHQDFYIQGLNQGTTTIIASAADHSDIEATLTVTDSGFYISAPSAISTTTHSSPSNITITTAQLHADGWWNTDQEVRAGLSVEVPVSIDDPLIGQITTSPVVFEAGLETSIITRFDPNTVGTTTVSVGQPAGFSAPVNRNRAIEAKVRAPDITLNDFSVGNDLQAQRAVHLSMTPPHPVDLILTVADPAIALISTERTSIGSGSISFNNVSTTASRLFYVQGLSHGVTTITASADGYNEVEATLTVTDSGFYISAPAAISTTTYSNPTNIHLRVARLQDDGSFSMNQEVRAGLSVEVPIYSADPLIGQITSPAVFEPGQESSITQFNPNAVGTTTVDLTQPVGFTAPTSRNQSIEAEVRTPNITLSDFSVGKDLQGLSYVQLSVSPPEPVDLVLSVADSAIALISTERTTVGSNSITISNVSNTSGRQFFVQGLSQGVTTIIATAPGYNDVQATLIVTESGFYIHWPSSISTTTYSNPTNIHLRVARLQDDGSFSMNQEVRAGLSVEVPIYSADPLIGQITSPAVFEPGQESSITQFNPNAVGTTTVDLTQPVGFTAPTNRNQSIEAEVRTPNITLSDFSVGKDLQGLSYVQLSMSPPEPVDLVLSVADPNIALISVARAAVGSGSITLSGIGDNASVFYLQGLSQGATTITAAAAGYDDRMANLTVTDSGFFISAPAAISTTTDSHPTSIQLRTARLRVNGSFSAYQEVRAGLSIEVPINSADPLIGQMTTNPVVFEGGQESRVTRFDPNAVGTTTVNLSQPDGFTAPTDRNQSIDASVND
jgi:large repetitive protein